MPNTFQPIRMAKLDWRVRQQYLSASRLFLCQDEEGRPGRDYLIKKRELDFCTIGNFCLGYMPFSTGTSFGGRIIMPIHDVYGELVALSARPATDDKEILDDVGKYWNESYGKGDNLYGLNIAKYSIGKCNCAIVVEGQMDVLAMHSYGFYNTVGILGGAFKWYHGVLLRRLCENIVVLMDADKAGIKHASKFKESIDAFCGNNDMKWCNVLLDGEHKDPDLYLKAHGANKLRGLIADVMNQNGLSLSTFGQTRI